MEVYAVGTPPKYIAHMSEDDVRALRFAVSMGYAEARRQADDDLQGEFSRIGELLQMALFLGGAEAHPE